MAHACMVMQGNGCVFGELQEFKNCKLKLEFLLFNPKTKNSMPVRTLKTLSAMMVIQCHHILYLATSLAVNDTLFLTVWKLG